MFRILFACMHFFSVFFAPQHLPLNHHFQHSISPTSVPTIALSQTPSETPSPTDAISLTPTLDPSPSAEVTIMPTVTLTQSPTIAPSETPTPTPSVTVTRTPSVTPTPLPSATPTPTQTVTPSPVMTSAPSPTPTKTPTPTMTLTPTPTASPSLTPTVILTPTLTPIATASPTFDPTPTATPEVTLTPTPTITKIGNDISYPQCGKPLPVGSGFGIVGINGGIASTTNPCLSTQLLWAGQTLGTLNQQKVQLYVNTGNPGGLGTVTWPHNNTDPLGNVSPNPQGTCDGSNSTACAWQYGWNRAVDDVVNRFVPAALSVGVDATPADYPWWLDVETTNSWDSGSDTALQNNRVDLEAMVAYFQSRGITVGIYSTSFQWGVIAGAVPSTSNLNGLHSWIPGATDASSAQSRCSLSPLTTGGSVSMTQFSTTDFDYDYSCL